MSAACGFCGTPLAADQRYCLACGLRCAPDLPRLAALPWVGAAADAPSAVVQPGVGPRDRVGRPVLRSAVITAVVVLSGGVAIGATLGPATVGETAAAQSPLLLVSSPPAATPPRALAPVALTPPSADLVGDGDESADGGFDAGPPALVEPAPAPEAAEPSSSSEGAEADADEPAPREDDAAAPPDGDDDEPAPALPGLRQLAGIVVATDARGEGFVLADRDGQLLKVHASGCGVVAGDDLHLRARRLANGRWAADRIRRLRSGVGRVSVVGVVTYADPRTGRYALSAGSATLLVTAAQAPAGPSTSAPQAVVAEPPASQPVVTQPPAEPQAAPPSAAPPSAAPPQAAPPSAAPPQAPPPSAATTPPPATESPSPGPQPPVEPPAPPTPTAAPPAPAEPGATPPPFPAVGERIRVGLSVTTLEAGGPDVLVERNRRMLPPAGAEDRPQTSPPEPPPTSVQGQCRIDHPHGGLTDAPPRQPRSSTSASSRALRG